MNAWRRAWQQRCFQAQFVFGLLTVLTILYSFAQFVTFIERRPGTVLPDPVLALFPAKNVTWIIFSLSYFAGLIGLFYLGQQPKRLLLALQAYILLIVSRMLAIYLVPLDPPPGLIPLLDPFIAHWGSTPIWTKDLFFSGHTATMFLLFLTANSRNLKIYFLANAILLGVCVVWQHVHYVIDVLAAPLFAYFCCRTVSLIHRKFRQGIKPASPHLLCPEKRI